MLHPSYSDLMKVVNSGVEEGEEPVVNSRYSIVLATAKRARQIIARQSKGDLDVRTVSKPLSKAEKVAPISQYPIIEHIIKILRL